jgi:hypothetical protein
LCGLGISRALAEAGDAGQDFLGTFGPRKGFWVGIVRVKKLKKMARSNSLALRWAPRRICFIVSSANQRSTRFS